MAETDAPVRDGDRLDYLDILRGFAVLAIFAVNIKAMAMPFGYYMNETLWPGEHDELVATIQAFVIDNKWRTNFTALFGAGLVLIGMKAEASGHSGRGRILVRNTWLLVFGLVHLLLIWMGDILTLYAIAGFIAIWFRTLSAKALGWWTFGILTLGIVWTSLFGVGPAFVPEVAQEVGAIMWGSDPVIVQAEIDAMLGSPLDQTAARIASAGETMLLYYGAGGWLMMTIGIMVAGMLLFRIDFFTGGWSGGNYLVLAIIALALSWGLEALRQDYLGHEGWTIEAHSLYTPVSTISGLAGAFGYASLVGFLYRTGLRFSPVAAAGRMAFTNYIACSLIGTTIFYGHGGGLFGSVTNLQLMGIVAGVWLAILIWSPIWLRYFRFGPLEWLWRSLTYWKIQPFRRGGIGKPAAAKDGAEPEETA